MPSPSKPEFRWEEAVPALFRAIFSAIFTLFTGPPSSRISRSAEVAELQRLHAEVVTLAKSFDLATEEKVNEFALELAVEACEEAGVSPDVARLSPFLDLTLELMRADGIWEPLEIDWSGPFGLEEEAALRRYLRIQKKIFSNEQYYIERWRETLFNTYSGILGYLGTDFSEDEREQSGAIAFDVPLIECLGKPAEVVERTLVTFADEPLVRAEFFSDLRDQLDGNILRISGIDPDGRYGTNRKVIIPTEHKDQTPTVLVDQYFRGTPLKPFFEHEYQIAMPDSIRFEHTHIVGGTGHGKTQLLQYLIHNDLQRVASGSCGLCVIDSQGDLIRKLSHLALFDPSVKNALSEKFLLIDPEDIEHPASLNMFDLHTDRVHELPAVHREKILNGTIELYEYMFGALLGAELTQRQDVIFRFLARLMMSIPDATIHTLRELMEDARPFQKYIEQLDGTTRIFFETQFNQPTYNQTKKQILTRLWGILSNSSLERMFSNTRNKVDMLAAMNEGKVVLINTAKDLLKTDGCHILGRFFIAQIAQAVLERSAQAEAQRLPFMVYIDEAQEYFDDHVEALLTQARKYNVAIHLAHQTLGQLTPRLKGTLMTNTSVKFVGGVSARDASEFATEMHTTSEYIQESRKQRSYTEFALWLKNVTDGALRVPIPFGVLESEETLDDVSYSALIERNRDQYSAHDDERRAAQYIPKKSAPTPPVEVGSPPTQAIEQVAESPRDGDTPLVQKSEPRKPESGSKPTQSKSQETVQPQGKGGAQHKYLQQLVKKVAEERGYGARIEEAVLGGSGSIDVSLQRNDEKIAIEISVTTDPEHEQDNIRKCLSSGYDHVVLLSADTKSVRRHEKVTREALESEYQDKVQFYTPEEFIEFLDRRVAEGAAKESTVRGYKVKVNYSTLSEAEKKRRKDAIAKVIVQSMKGMKT